MRNKKYKYLKYISLGLLILSFMIFIVGIFIDQTVVGLSLVGIITLILEIISLICCIIFNIKQEKNTLVYILLIISILSALFNSLFLINDIQNNLRSKKYYNSEKFLTETAKLYEESIEYNISKSEILKQLYKEDVEIISLDNLVKVADVGYINTLEEHGYTCDGYIELKQDHNYSKDEFYKIINDEYAENYTMDKFFHDIKAYVNCQGKYSYQTDGYDINKIQG